MKLPHLLIHRKWIVCSLLLAFQSCQAPTAPDFKDFQNIKTKMININTIQLSGDAVYDNPNNISTKLKFIDLDVFVDDKLLGNLEQKSETTIGAASEFKIPVQMNLDLNKLKNENKGILKNSLKKLFNEELKLQYIGSMTFEILGVEVSVPVDYSEKVSIGVNWN